MRYVIFVLSGSKYFASRLAAIAIMLSLISASTLKLPAVRNICCQLNQSINRATREETN